MHVYVCMHACAKVCMWRPEDNLQESSLSYHTGFGDPPHCITIGGSPLQLSHFSNPLVLRAVWPFGLLGVSPGIQSRLFWFGAIGCQTHERLYHFFLVPIGWTTYGQAPMGIFQGIFLSPS